MGTALVLRVCNADGTSYDGFQWPNEVGATVSAPDFRPTAECGFGLHGWLYGAGDHTTTEHCRRADALWYVLEVEESQLIDLQRKVKFPTCTIKFVGDKFSATSYLVENEPRCSDVPVIGRLCTVGNNGYAVAGALSTLTGGAGSTLMGGYASTLTGGAGSTLKGGNRSTLTGGDGSTLKCGKWSTLMGGNRSTLMGGDYSTLTGGNRSTLTGGNWSTLMGGDGSTLTGGEGSTLIFEFYDIRKRVVVAYVGENGIAPNVPYKLVNGVVTKVEQQG